MTAVARRRPVSRVDKEFLARLRRLQQIELDKAHKVSPSGVAAKTIFKEPVARELERRRRRWEFDGSILIGRIDTPDGRFYVGRRRVLDDGTPVVYSVDDPEIRQRWAASAADPGDVLLKRLLSVEGWDILDWTTEFDLRTTPPPRQPRPPAGIDHHELEQTITLLEADQPALQRLLAQAADRVNDGRPVDTGMVTAVRAWNGRLADAAQRAGLAESDTTLAKIRAAAAAARQDRRRAAEEALRDLFRRFPELENDFAGRLDSPDMPVTRHAGGPLTIACGGIR